MQLFCNFNIFMLYDGLRHIMEQREHCETNYTHNILYINDEAEIVNKDDKNDSDDKESDGNGDDDDYKDSG